MRSYVILMLSVALFVAVASAANQTVSQVFNASGGNITPPGIEGTPAPEAPRAAGGNVLAAFAEASVAKSAADTAAFSQSGPISIGLKFVDLDSEQKITNAHVRLTLTSGQQVIETLRFISNESTSEIQLAQGTWNIRAKLDFTETPGKDFYGELDADVSYERNFTVLMRPVGSLRGEVFGPDGRLVPGAAIKLECSGDYGDLREPRTDEFGSFTSEWLPVGSCRVSALSGGKTGFANALVVKGQLSEISIRLEQEVIEQTDYSWLLIVALIVLGTVIGVVFYKRKRSVVMSPAGNGIAARPIQSDRHMDAIMSALDETERKIIDSLMASGGKSQQNKMGREMSLPKSSLSRAISGLEARNLVKTEKLGRVKRVELSEWFLNGKKG